MKKSKTLMEVFAEANDQDDGDQEMDRPLAQEPQKGRFNVAGQVIAHPKLKGEWVIVATQMAGGSTGCGMNGHDDYPDGHEIVLRKARCSSLGGGCVEFGIDWKTPEKRFYQDGCFVDEVMLTNPKVVRDLRK